MSPIELQYSCLKQRLDCAGRTGILLDIDDTISDTNTFWAAHLIKDLGNPEQLSAAELTRKYRYVRNVPYWDGKKADEWIETQLRADSVQKSLPVVEGAVQAVNRIHSAMPVHGYLTGRPACVQDGTRYWLDKNGFPEAEVIFQPSKEALGDLGIVDGNAWKARVLEYLYPTIAGIIDDNAEMAAQLSTGYRGTVYLFSHTVNPKPSLDIICCNDWEDAVRRIESVHRGK